jgi:serine protease Do
MSASSEHPSGRGITLVLMTRGARVLAALSAIASRAGRPALWLSICIAALLGVSVVVMRYPLADGDVVAGRLLPTVVVIVATRIDTGGADDHAAKLSRERGSGFIVDPAGFIVTNKHVVDGATEIRATLSDGTSLEATLAGKSQQTDIALLKVRPQRPLPTVRFADSDRIRVGEDVIAIGNPLGFANSVSAGIVSALNRDIMESAFDDYIQTDAAINHGNSGGPLFDRSGQVIGMNSVIFAPGDYGGSIGLGFAIPSNDIRFVIDQLRQHGDVRIGSLGIQFQEVTAALRDSIGLPQDAEGAIVVEVPSGSPGAAAGLQVGDVILQFAGQHVTDARALARAIARAPIHGRSALQIWRDGHRVKLEAVAEIAPDKVPAGAAGPSIPQAAAEKAARRFGLSLDEATKLLPPADGGTLVAQRGARVAEVAQNSAASEAGLAVGDVILMADHAPVTDAAEIMRALHASRASGREFAPLLVQSPDGAIRFVAMPSFVSE